MKKIILFLIAVLVIPAVIAVYCDSYLDCDDEQYCTGQETCVAHECVAGTPVDCSGNDIIAIAACDYDNDVFTWDYREAFTSVCEEIECGYVCTSGDETITHTCDITTCGAECDSNDDCEDVECDHLDGCQGNDWYDYDDVANDCLDCCTCEENTCTEYTIYTNDRRCIGECLTDEDCGTDGFVCTGFCKDNDVYRFYRIYTCHNPGTLGSCCSFEDSETLETGCGESGLGSKYCVDNSVYQHDYIRGCSDGSCTEEDNPIFIESCASNLVCYYGSCVDSITITNKLAIEKIKFTYNGKDKTAKDGDTVRNIEPGMTLKLKIYVQNLFTDEEDIEIEDVEITATIENIDDGDDLEEESDEFDIKAGKTKSETLTFEIPLLVDEETYDMIIEIEGEDENNTKHEVEAKIELEVEKDKHKLIIHKAILDPKTIICDGETFLDLKVINLGSEDEEEVVITLKNDELNFNRKEELELDSADDEEAIFSESYLIDVPEGLKAGIYPIEIKVFYNEDNLEDTEQVDLTIEECEAEEEEIAEEEIEEEEEEIEEEEEVEEEPKETFWEKYGLALLIVGYILAIIFLVALIIHALSK